MTGEGQPLIESVTATALQVPASDWEADGTFGWEATTMVVVEASGGGARGLGWTYSAAGAADLIRRMLGPAVTGLAIADVGRAATAMELAVRNVGPGGIAAHARSAVDVALWDLKARHLGIPLVDLLGATREAVPVYGSGGFTSLDDESLVHQIQGWLEQGIDAVKIKVGRDPRVDAHRLAVIRRVIGPDRALMVDANGGYQRAEALAWAERFGEAGAVWLEEPLSSRDVDGLRLLRDRAPGGLAIAAGEYVDTLASARRLLEAGAVDVLQLDATRCGGFTGFLAAAALARAFEVPVSAHCAPSLHRAVAAAVPDLLHVEWFHDHARIERHLLDGFAEPADGTLAVDRSSPGSGLALRTGATTRFRAPEAA